MRTFVFIGLLLVYSCIKQQKDKEPATIGNQDYQPYCPPLNPGPQATQSEWTKKYQKNFQLDPNKDDGFCTFEEETE